MKILALSHSCITDVNQELYIALNRIPDVQVELIVPASWKSEYSGQIVTPKQLPGVDFPMHTLPIALPGRNSLYFYRQGLAHTIRAAKPDVVYVHEEPWSLAAAQVARVCRSLKTPFLCYTMQNIVKRYPWPFSAIEKHMHRNAAALIALSEEVRDVLHYKGFSGKSPLLALSCDLSLFYPGTSPELRKKLGLQGTVIGYMGRFVTEKGLDTLVEALARLRQQHPERPLTALIIGSGSAEEALKQQVADAGLGEQVIFPGSIPHILAGDYMRCLDIFVIPSKTTAAWKEQFGRVIIEAMACEIPVVGSDSGQIPYLIHDAGGGLVFAEGDQEDLASKLLTLLDDPELRVRLGKAGAASVQDRYTHSAIAQQLFQILEEASCREK